MDSAEDVFADAPLPLPSLRLLVPPLQLMTASMWRVIKLQDVQNYWKVAEFVSFVMELVPELLLYKHWTQLNMGLRAKYVLELCRAKELVEPGLVASHLDWVRTPHPPAAAEEESGMEAAEANFVKLVHTLIKHPEEKHVFFSEVFPVEYGPQFDSDLQTLFEELLSRLAQLLPIPDLEQTVSWLGNASVVLDDCVRAVSEPTDLRGLLQHQKRLGLVEQHVPPSSMGDCILSSLAGPALARVSSQSGSLHDLGDDVLAASFVVDDGVGMEVIAVTDYAEVELGTCGDAQVGTGEEEVAATGSVTVESPSRPRGEEEDDEEEEDRDMEDTPGAERPGQEACVGHAASPGRPHCCAECGKQFRFSSSLTAHRVVHTGERPHRCPSCGRRFSFRQSLDRHRRTHGTEPAYGREARGRTFPSLSARREQAHGGSQTRTCCDRRFSCEAELARHLEIHVDGRDSDGSAENPEAEVALVTDAEERRAEVPQTDQRGAAVGQGGEDSGAKPAVKESLNGHASSSSTSEPGVLVPKMVDEVISLVKVRTSGRKRKPTMKVQVINLQKRIGRAYGRKQGAATEKLKGSKPAPFNSSEHSYGSSGVCVGTETAEEDGSSQSFSCPPSPNHHGDDAAPSHRPTAHQDGRFGCPDCDKSFKFKSLLKAHGRVHTGEQPFLCSQCGRRFSFKQSLERHKQTHRDGRQRACAVCGELFTSLSAQREHEGGHVAENGDYPCSRCGRTFAAKSALVRHLKTHGEAGGGSAQRHRCPQCHLGFSGAAHLARHLQTHGGERPHACNCGKSFPCKAALTAHQRVHRTERPYQCTQCGKGFLYRGGLLNHAKIHSEEMPYACSFCGKSFKRERNMKKHERCHTRENVFRCSQCDKTFVYKATLTRHELTHSGERPFLCSDCGKGFFSHAELLKHERFHTGHKPFQCPFCGKRFTQSCYLTIHVRYHTGARPYSCTECEKSFLSANRLKRHQRTHTGEKPYLCAECGKGFKQSYHLKVHQRTHAYT